MSGKISLKIASKTPAAALSPEQERFRYLIAQLEKVRKSHADWDASVLKFRNDHLQKMQPLRASLSGVCRDTVLVLDGLLDQPGWSRSDRAALQDLLCGNAGPLLDANPEDAELKALFDKHSTVAFDAAKREELQHLKEEAEDFTGLDLGDIDGLRTEDDLVQRVYEEMAAREAANQARHDDDSQRHRKTAAQRRAEDDAQLAKQSLREIYRRLASAVHPDRESDAQRREQKNALMQKINQAYASNDLFALFEAQIEIEQLDADDIGEMATQRLKQYNKLLARQLEDAKEKLRSQQANFRMDYELSPGEGLTPQKMSLLIQRQGRAIRAEIARQKQFLEVLASKTSTKRWLKEQRRFARAFDVLDDDE